MYCSSAAARQRRAALNTPTRSRTQVSNEVDPTDPSLPLTRQRIAEARKACAAKLTEVSV